MLDIIGIGRCRVGWLIFTGYSYGIGVAIAWPGFVECLSWTRWRMLPLPQVGFPLLIHEGSLGKLHFTVTRVLQLSFTMIKTIHNHHP